MTQATGARPLGGETQSGREARIIGLVGAAHFTSHAYMIVLPPIFAFIKDDYGVDYAAIGFAVAAFNIVSTVFQAPAGFLVDRMSPRSSLILALVVGASGLVFAGLLPFYWALIVGIAVAGLANTIYHPADYAILSHAVDGRRLGQAYSLHTFLGMVGTAVTPAAMLLFARNGGWHGALIAAAAVGYGVAAILLLDRTMVGEGISRRTSAARRAAEPSPSWRLLLSGPILRNIAFFILLSASGAGISTFAIVALPVLQGATLTVANLSLSAYLVTSALGVLAGGFIAVRTERHNRVAAAGLGASALAVLVVALLPLSAVWLVATLGAAGLFSGLVMPSRDLMVRAVTPPGAFGKVFGFVSTGFSIGQSIAPLVFGWLMDRNEPQFIFLLVVALTVLTLPLLHQNRPARGTTARPAARPGS